MKSVYINLKDYGNTWPWPHTAELLRRKPASKVNLTSGHELQEFVNRNNWQIEKCTTGWPKESMISLHSSFDKETFFSGALEAVTAEPGDFLHITFHVAFLVAWNGCLEAINSEGGTD